MGRKIWTWIPIFMDGLFSFCTSLFFVGLCCIQYIGTKSINSTKHLYNYWRLWCRLESDDGCISMVYAHNTPVIEFQKSGLISVGVWRSAGQWVQNHTPTKDRHRQDNATNFLCSPEKSMKTNKASQPHNVRWHSIRSCNVRVHLQRYTLKSKAIYSRTS